MDHVIDIILKKKEIICIGLRKFHYLCHSGDRQLVIAIQISVMTR